MFLKTIQASAFKNIFEVLKDILNDVNVSFSKKGIHMLTLDNYFWTPVNLKSIHVKMKSSLESILLMYSGF